MIRVGDIVNRLRTKVDPAIVSKDVLTQDGTNYTVVLGGSPVVSGSDEAYIRHTTFTTGLNQFVPRNGTQSAVFASGYNITYNINYTRGELNFYRGSGTIVASTGLIPFAPWNTSTVTVYYEKTKYSESLLGDYVSYAVAPVEAILQIGMYVSGISGVFAPVIRNTNDYVDYKTSTPYSSTEKFVIAEDLEIIQEMIAQKAALDLLTRERRIGAGNAIRIKDGDTEIDTSVNQRHVADFYKDIKAEYDAMCKWVMHNMLEGYSLQQINEQYPNSVFNGFQITIE